MKKKFYIFVLTFLCLLCGQMGYAGDVYRDENTAKGGVCDLDSVNYSFCECNGLPENCEALDEVIIYPKCDQRNPNYYNNICECEPEFCDTGDCTDSSSLAFPCVEQADPVCGEYGESAYLASCGCIGGNTGIDECPEDDTPTEPTEPGCSVTCDSGYIVNEELCECILNPCDINQQNIVKNQITDPYLASKLSNVKASLQPPNTSIESGFGIYKISTGNNVATPIVTGTSTNLTVTIGFGISDPNYTPSAVLHTHPSDGYANPSAGDIYGLAELYTRINTVTTSYVVAADGTTYAMVVTDPTALAEFLVAYPASTNQLDDSFNPGSPMDVLYQAAYKSFTNSGLSDAIAEERANAVVMAEAGINLLKAPANSTDFKQIQGTQLIDSNGNSTFTKSDCP